MSNLDKFNNAFVDVFGVDSIDLNDGFTKESVGNWDSVRQLSVVTTLEDTFEIMMDPEDIIGFTSYRVGKEILLKYGVTL